MGEQDLHWHWARLALYTPGEGLGREVVHRHRQIAQWELCDGIATCSSEQSWSYCWSHWGVLAGHATAVRKRQAGWAAAGAGGRIAVVVVVVVVAVSPRLFSRNGNGKISWVSGAGQQPLDDPASPSPWLGRLLSFFLFIVDRAVSAVHHEAYKAKRIGGADDREKCRRIKEKKIQWRHPPVGQTKQVLCFFSLLLISFFARVEGCIQRILEKSAVYVMRIIHEVQ